MTKNICISGYYGFDNFGDETILKILIENLRHIGNITVFSVNPVKTKNDYNIDSVYSFSIKEVLSKVKTCDCLISGGGSLLQDATSLKSLIYYLSVISCAILYKKKIIIFAQGLGPIKNKLFKIITPYILKKADYITLRDENSYDMLKKYTKKISLCADPVWNITAPDVQKTENLGIQLRNYPSLSADFLDKLAENINKYYCNKKICLLSLQNSSDLNICKTFKDKLLNINNKLDIEIIENKNNEKIIQDIASLKEIIAMRYHACLIAIKCGVKVLPINYDIKVKILAEKFNLDYLNPQNFGNTDEIIKKFAHSSIDYDYNEIQKQKFDFEKIKNII